MTEAPDEKIHPFLPRSFAERRRQVVARQAEAALRFELADERIEEREYDEQERLRVHRIIDRKVFRGEACQRYAALVAGWRTTMGEDELAARLRSQLEADLEAVAAPESLTLDPQRAVCRYEEIVPATEWPAVLCMAAGEGAAAALRGRLQTLGFPLLSAGALERFGIVKFACPPEIGFARQIAGMAEACSLAAAATPVAAPEPMRVTAMMAEARHMLGLTPEMSERYGQDSVIAILDSGLDFSHPAFGRVSRDDYRNFTSAGDEDLDGHGTHVASIAAGADPAQGGRYGGVAPCARLVFGKVIARGGAADLETVLHGMAWAVFDKQADILSLSMGDPGTPANGRSIWTRACEEAFRHGTVVCVAAGNREDAGPETVVVPGDASSVVTVGAVDKDGRLAPFSAQGSTDPSSPLYGKPNCVGPGVDIVGARSSQASYAPDQVIDPLHARLSGTSMAVPAVAGCLALLKSRARALGWEIPAAEMVAAFYAACRPVRGPAGEAYRPDIEIGHGLVDMGSAFEEIERRAARRPLAEAAGSRPQPPPSPAAVRVAPPPEPAGMPAADLCYRCGRRYLSQIGTFSPVWQCRACGAPICVVCWQAGERECERHRGAASSPAREAVARPAGQDAEEATMNEPNPPIPHPPAAPVADWGTTFLNRFDFKVRRAARIVNPLSGEHFEVGSEVRPQTFRRSFGEVVVFPLVSGLIRRSRLHLAAVSLAAGGPETRPPEDLLRRIAGPEGLDMQDDTFYAVGIFSPGGWPEERLRRSELRGNAVYYLVYKLEGTRWGVLGPEGPLASLFDPEILDEKRARARAALDNHPRLVLPGDQLPLEALLEQGHLDPVTVGHVVAASGGLFRIIEHRGKSYIQRCTR